MYSKILVPVDLTHANQLPKALKTAADLSNHFQAPVIYVSVASSAPNPVAHNPTEFQQKLDEFAREQASQHGHQASAKAVISHDPAIEVDDALLNAVSETGADLVVMASHIPGLTEYIWPSHGGKVASHSQASVFVVR